MSTSALKIAATGAAVFAFVGTAPALVSFAAPAPAPAPAPAKHGQSLARRVAALEARADCIRIVAPVSQFGQDGGPLIGTGFFYIDNVDPGRTRIYTTSALDLDPESATPTMYVATVSPRCVKGSHPLFLRAKGARLRAWRQIERR